MRNPVRPMPFLSAFLLGALLFFMSSAVHAQAVLGQNDPGEKDPSSSSSGALDEQAAKTEAEEKAPTEWTSDLMMQVRPVGDVNLSADGRWVAYTVREVVMEPGKSEFRTQIYRAPADGSSAHQMTFDEAGASTPKQSPDGVWMAFISSRAGRNLFVMRADGGEAWQLTSVETGVGAFIWSKDSKQIVYTVAEGPSDEEAGRKKDKDDAYVVGKLRGHAHLWLVDMPEKAGRLGESRRLTEGDFNVSPAYQSGFDISPDGKTVIYARSLSSRANEWPTADLYAVEVESGELRPFLNSGAAESDPHYSPNGKWVAFSLSESPPSWAFTGDIAVVPADGSTKPRVLGLTHDRGRTQILGWSPNSERVYFTEARGTLTRVAYLPLDGGPAVDIEIGDRVSNSISWAPKAGRLALALESFYEAPEVFVIDADGGDRTQVSAANAGILDLPLPKAEVIRWQSKDGLEIEGILIQPANKGADGPVPLLLNIHGGPTGVYRRQFLASANFHPLAALAAEGFAVLRCNIRGSSGYGRDFRHGNMNDWGGLDFQDLMTGVDHVIKMGVADPERLGVFGWSYGGYMTSWIITQTDRFRAAVIGAPVTNLMSFNGTSDIPDFVPDYFSGDFWEQPEIYQARSAMFQIKNAKTPSLILHGEADARVPISQSHELHTALQRLGIETEMVVYPRMPHGPREPRQLLDLSRRHMDWFRRHVLEPQGSHTGVSVKGSH